MWNIGRHHLTKELLVVDYQVNKKDVDWYEVPSLAIALVAMPNNLTRAKQNLTS